jgi:hypothetical protein
MKTHCSKNREPRVLYLVIHFHLWSPYFIIYVWMEPLLLCGQNWPNVASMYQYSHTHTHTHNTVPYSHILCGELFRPWMWAIIRSIYTNSKMHTESLCNIRLASNIKNTLKIRINCIRILSNYKRPKDKKNSTNIFKIFKNTKYE